MPTTTLMLVQTPCLQIAPVQKPKSPGSTGEHPECNGRPQQMCSTSSVSYAMKRSALNFETGPLYRENKKYGSPIKTANFGSRQQTTEPHFYLRQQLNKGTNNSFLTITTIFEVHLLAYMIDFDSRHSLSI